MKKLLVQFLFLSVSYVAAFADEKPVEQPALGNPFAAALQGLPPALVAKLTVNEDLSSRFTLAHPVEQSRYTWLYMNTYTWPVYGATANANPQPPTQPLPPSLDAGGHPLWFDGYQGEMTLLTIVRDLFEAKRYDDLDRLFALWSDPTEVLADGRPKLRIFKYPMAQPNASADAWDKMENGIDDWRRKSPKSIAAALAEAVYWSQYAWDARGQGYASSVSSEGWSLYVERLRRSERVLQESKPFSEQSPIWGDLSINVAGELGQSNQNLLALFLQQVQAHKDFLPLYLTMADLMMPKWGGSWESVEIVAREALLQTKKEFGYTFYSRVYWGISLSQTEDPNIFRYSKASWLDVKHGFDDMANLYPHSAQILNRYAAMACMAEDKETYENVRFKLGKETLPETWPYNYTLDLCDHKYPKQKL